ncbi:hypothetical protein ZWY2020_038833, partial [Hordeum vulgare]
IGAGNLDPVAPPLPSATPLSSACGSFPDVFLHDVGGLPLFWTVPRRNWSLEFNYINYDRSSVSFMSDNHLIWMDGSHGLVGGVPFLPTSSFFFSLDFLLLGDRALRALAHLVSILRIDKTFGLHHIQLFLKETGIIPTGRSEVYFGKGRERVTDDGSDPSTTVHACMHAWLCTRVSVGRETIRADLRRFSHGCPTTYLHDGFPLDHEFPEDYSLEEGDDDMDIDGEPLFEEKLANQTFAGLIAKGYIQRQGVDYDEVANERLHGYPKEEARDGPSLPLVHSVAVAAWLSLAPTGISGSSTPFDPPSVAWLLHTMSRWVPIIRADQLEWLCWCLHLEVYLEFESVLMRGLLNSSLCSLERRAKILDDSSTLAKGVDGDFIAPDSLVQEVVNLVEAPVPILGRYDDSFLELPKDVLTTVMQKHQRYFPVISKSTGDLLPYFITVANGSISEEVVRKGNEAVLRARYEDAKFFYKMDTQKNLSKFRGQLKSILFHLTLVLGINERMIPVVKDAATLAMSDLATSIVTEFTSLAGIMAHHYALRDGLPEQIAEALFEITLPRFSGDVFPKTDAGIVLAVADRLDSLVGLFGAGCQPSSSNDPFGLRRISYGLVQILVENKKNFDLTKALTLMAEVQPIRIDSDIINEVVQFVTRRLEQLLVDEGINCEIVRSVLMERANCPYLASQTVAEMEAFSRTKDFPKIVEAYSWPVRIIRGKKIESAWEVDASVFEKDEEKALWSAYLEVANKIHPGIDVKTFAESSLLLIQPLEDFFNNVFVMAKDEKIRNNRLALLQKVASLTKGIADLSVLPGF